MNRVGTVLTAVSFAVIPALAGQSVAVRTALFFERYTFDSLSFAAVSEFTVPVTVTAGLGRWGNLTVGGGFVKVDLEGRAGQMNDQSVSGALDTEMRLVLNLMPGRLMLLVNGAIPTGIQSVTIPELSILTVVSRDIIGFAASDLGTGGYLGSGLAGAIPVGQMALGLAASYRYQFDYQPIQGESNTLQPGSEVRIRAGLEGPLARRTYLRAAGVFALRQNDLINGSTVNGVGNRLIGYASLNQGITATSNVTLYAYDVFRSDPRIEPSAIGAALVPRGNLLAAGAQFDYRINVKTGLIPFVEYRLSHAASDTSVSAPLEQAGSSWRIGLDLRRQLSPRVNLVINGSALAGNVRRLAGLQANVDLNGYRVGVLLQARR